MDLVIHDDDRHAALYVTMNCSEFKIVRQMNNGGYRKGVVGGKKGTIRCQMQGLEITKFIIE